jgi:hypothetical protein
MKKRVMVMTILLALSFLVSMIAVVPSFAPVQTPATQKPKILTKPNPAVYQLPKEKFWALEFDRCDVNGVKWNATSSKLNVQVGQPVTFRCWYKIKTSPVSDITEADAAKWGKGNYSYTLRTQVNNLDSHAEFKKEEIRSLPKFTWSDVQQWKHGGWGSAPKGWEISQECKWTPDSAYLGDANAFHFCVDCANVIEEYDGGQNDYIVGVITVNP